MRTEHREKIGTRRPGIRSLGVVAAIAVASLVGREAHAEDKKAAAKKVCTDAYVKAQDLRRSHSFKEASEQLKLCAQPSCAAFIVKDCTAWLADIDARMPGVVLEAHDDHGQQIPDVTVSMDGKELVTKLDGRSVEVDPGEHTFSFTVSPGTTIEQRFAVAEGDKAQRVVVTIRTSSPTAAGDGKAPSDGAIAATPPPPPVHGARFWTTPRAVGVPVAAVGVAGLAVGAVFAILGSSAHSKQLNDCPSVSSCPNLAQARIDHTDSVHDATIEGIGFIAGGVALATGVGLLAFGGHRGEPSDAATAWVIAPSFGATGGGVLIGKGF